MKNSFLPWDLWYEVFGLLDIDEAIAVSKASPRYFGEIFHRNDNKVGVYNHSDRSPWFGAYPSDLAISNNCHLGEYSSSRLGGSYGCGTGLNQYSMLGQERFRVVDYEVFKIVIE
jgi:hypothetical protein